MSSRYQKAFTIPEGFPQLLKTFAREILRAQPDNIYEFGARYFAELVEARNAEFADQGGGGMSLTEMSANELEEFILQLFLEADSDGNGYLDRKEFKTLMKSANLGLSKSEIRAVMSEADDNDDGVIEYREFVPIMVQVVQALKAKEQAEVEKAYAEMEAREEVENFLLHGMPRAELEAMMSNVFKAADTDGSGQLDRKEFKKCLKSAELGLTKKDINLLLSEADYDGDGNISYDEFMPLCFNILVERFKDQVMANKALQSNDELEQLLISQFGEGFAKRKALKAALTELSYDLLGLTNLQISTIMSLAEEVAREGEGKMVDCLKFAKSAAGMIWTMVDVSAQEKRMKAIQTMADSEGAYLLHGHTPETVKQVLGMAFEEADADKSGYLDRDEMETVIESLGTSELGLSAREIASLISSIDENDDGKVSYAELVNFFFDILMHLEREEFVQQNAFMNMEAELGM